MPPGLAGGDRHFTPHGTSMTHHCPLAAFQMQGMESPWRLTWPCPRAAEQDSSDSGQGVQLSLVTGLARGQVGTGTLLGWLPARVWFPATFSCLSRGCVLWLHRYHTDLAGWMLPSLSIRNRRLFFTALAWHYHSIAIFYLHAVSVWNSLLWDSLGWKALCKFETISECH